MLEKCYTLVDGHRHFDGVGVDELRIGRNRRIDIEESGAVVTLPIFLDQRDPVGVEQRTQTAGEHRGEICP